VQFTKHVYKRNKIDYIVKNMEISVCLAGCGSSGNGFGSGSSEEAVPLEDVKPF